MDAVTGPSQLIINAQKELARRRHLAGISYRPPAAENVQSGGQGTVSTAVPGSQSTVDSGQGSVGSSRNIASGVGSAKKNPHAPFHTPHSARLVRLSPTLAAYCLDGKNHHQGARLDGPYRLYKVLQTLDEQGRGWLANRWVEQLLTRKSSAYHIYGRRQLKIMLRRGEGLFWHRARSGDELRIRLVARGKVVRMLDCGPLRGREVTLPFPYLLGSGRGRQAAVNAALYAAVHAGRSARTPAPSPISRARLELLTGCSRYRQRSYERRMKITVRHNIHIASVHSAYELERARQHLGLSAYKHTDYQGKINCHRPGAAYIAVRLPNSYHVPDTVSVVLSQRQRTINRFLDGLCHQGSGGSGRKEIVRLFHRDVATAVRAFQRDQGTPAYWPMVGNSHARLWQAFGQSSTAAEWHGTRVHFHSEFPIPHLKGGDLN